MKHGWSRSSTLAAAMFGFLAGNVLYADDTANMTVTANVAPSCEVQAVETIAFGTLDPLLDNDAEGDITWVCTSGFDTEIRLGGGGSGDIDARTMSGAGTLPYQLYTDAARTAVFGDGSTGDTVPVSGVGYGNPGTVTVYGRVEQVDAGAALSGNYSDTVQVTIVF